MSKLYKCRVYLFCLYWLLELPANKIGEDCNVTPNTIYNWLSKFNIPRRTKKEATKIAMNRPEVKKNHRKVMKLALNKPKYKVKQSKIMKIVYSNPEVREKISGENSSSWIEWKELMLLSKHIRMRKELVKIGIFEPDYCPICNKPKGEKKLDLMNIDHQYNENIFDYYYICTKCHTGVYEFLAGLKKGKIKPIPNLIQNLSQLQTRIEREQLLKNVILKYINKIEICEVIC